MLRITSSMEDGTLLLRVEGNLVGPWVEECRAACARETGRGQRFALDLRELRFADAGGVEFLSRMDARGLVSRSSSFVKELLRSEEAAMRRTSRVEGTDGQHAREELVRRHGGAMLALARRLLRREEDARRALAEAFGVAFRHPGTAAGRSGTDAGLRRIVIGVCVERLRSGAGRPAAPIDDLLPDFDEAGCHARPIGAWDRGELPDGSETLAEVRRCIDELPDEHRTVLVLRDVEGLGARETAELLGLPLTVIETRLHRARQALLTLLRPRSVAAG